jgi:uncharacterized protein YjbI with pentapeptide repeats
MANPEHIMIVQQGAEAIRTWRETYPEERFDLMDADLCKANLAGANLQYANLQNAVLVDADLQGANLCEANLTKATLAMANLQAAQLSGANLQNAHLGGANLQKAHLGGKSLEEAVEDWDDLQKPGWRPAELVKAFLGSVDLQEADLRRVNLQEADLRAANLQKANLYRANLVGAILWIEKLQGTNLHEANLAGADLQHANLQGANLYRANLAKANLARVKNANEACNLVTVRLDGGDVRYFDTYDRPWLDCVADWERLRIMGRLPLFGASYMALILIPLVFSCLAFYNSKIALIRAWATHAVTLSEHLFHQPASLVLEHLQPLPIPRFSLVLLVSTVLLAIASTLYSLCCPSRIKEFSRDQWCDQLGRSLLHYWPLAWRDRPTRLICAVCYICGGAGVLWVIGAKVWGTAMFILKHSVIASP